MSLFSSSSFLTNLLKRRSPLFLTSLVFSVLLVTILYFSFSENFLRAQTSESCSKVNNPRPGINCSYLGLPRCSAVSNPLPRQNCADIIDLPLCSEFSSGANSGNNCVTECTSDSNQIHNQNCIRFCNSSPGSDCIYRKCHHFSSVQASADPLYSTCNSIECNLLTVQELDDPKFNDDSKKYCEGSLVKCYAFTKEQLPYIKFRANNTMCQIHDCYGPVCLSKNDTLNITSKNGTTKPISNCANNNKEYQCIYQKTFNGDETKDVTIDVTDPSVSQNASICKMASCKPKIDQAYFECTGQNKNIAVSQCGSNPCKNGYCPATNVDCNLDSNANLDACRSPESDLSLNDNPQTDSGHQSWFYRPTPPFETIDAKGNLQLGKKSQKDQLCYNVSDLVANSFGTKTIFGWWYAIWDNQHKKMPICDENRGGSRGQGYSYLCTPGTFFSRANPERDGFIDGDVMGVYPGDSKDIGYKVRACLRYKNFWNLSVCGSRECKLSCAFSSLCDQWCGYDVCRDLIVREGSPDRCSYAKTPDLFAKSKSQIESNDQNIKYDCVSDSISDTRMRAVKYGRRVCVFLDYKGGSNNDIFFNGEKLTDGGTCIDGQPDGSGNCRGFNHNRNDGLIDLDKWRAVMTFQYIGNYLSSGGYTRKDGKFFKETQCALAPMKIGPSRFYAIGNKFNSPNLFGPPLYISGFSLRRGSDIGSNSSVTDFFFPELEVVFGNAKKKLSLGPGFINGASISKDQWVAECNSYSKARDKANCEDSPPFFDSLETSYNGFLYYTDLFVKKEYNPIVKKPIFCLYRKVFDEDGLAMAKLPVQVGCTERLLPEIMKINPANGKAVLNFDVDPDVGNKFNQAKIKFKLFNNPYSDSNPITLEDPDLNSFIPAKACANIEEHQFCAKRDECSKLYYECANNKIALNNAINNGTSVIELDRFEQECNGILRQNCNRKKGITTSSANDIYTQTNANSPPNPNAYGWYNEICINQGLESKLRKVVAYKVSDAMGKCLIDQVRSASSNCNDGGRAPDCVCLEYREGINISANQEVRVETPREAGLCIDIPKPNYCSAIDYTPSANLTDSNDPNFINNSLDKSFYSDTNGVHSSHQTRTNGLVYGRAEFASAIEGMNLVNGKCNGFWKVGMGNPKMNCNKNTDSNKESGVWSNLQNSCVRYKCPAITNAIIDTDGNYHPDYSNANFESGENKGALNGFALWPQLIKTNDFVETATATSCIVGFKPEGSNEQKLSGKIVGYSDGKLPKRKCNQFGVWKDLVEGSGSCERINCLPQNVVANPSTATDFASWADWGGAWFNDNTDTADNPNIIPTPASRAISFITEGSKITGSCNTAAGFYQMPGAPLPSRTCDSLGNWLPVENPCVTRCDAIADRLLAATSGNGFATWPGALDLPIGSSRTVFGTCVSGYVSNPYPTILDDGSTPASLPVLNPPPPTRTCSPVTSNGVTANVWSEVVNPCVNYCPGYEQDSRAGVGLTMHLHSRNGAQEIQWSKKSFNETEFKSNSSCLNMNAGTFSPDRDNGCYLLKRSCANNGIWSSPVSMCVANGGTIGHATYLFGDPEERDVGSITVANGVCVSGYEPSGSTKQPPTRVCRYKDNQRKIDQVFLDLTEGSSDCQPIACSIYKGQLFGNSIYNGPTRTNGVAQGEIINLSTRSDKCGTSSLKLTCKVENNIPGFTKSGVDAHDCRSCSLFSNFIGPDQRLYRKNSSHDCVWKDAKTSAVLSRIRNTCPSSFSSSISSGGTARIAFYTQNQRSSCISWNAGICLKAELRCNDGEWEFVRELSHDNACNKQDSQFPTVNCPQDSSVENSFVPL